MKKNKNYFVILSEAKNLAFGDSGWSFEEGIPIRRGGNTPFDTTLIRTGAKPPFFIRRGELTPFETTPKRQNKKD